MTLRDLRTRRAQAAAGLVLWCFAVAGGCGGTSEAHTSTEPQATGSPGTEDAAALSLSLPEYRERTGSGTPDSERTRTGRSDAPGTRLTRSGGTATGPVLTARTAERAAAAALPASAARVTRHSSGLIEIDARAVRRDVERHIANALAAAKKARKGDYDTRATTIAVTVVDVETGATVVDRLGNRALQPASNTKVLTVAAALLGLGVDAAFETRFEAHGPIEGGTLRGPLVVRAGADPMYRRDGDGALDPWWGQVTHALRQAGIRRIEGPVILDEGDFETPGPGPEWPGESQWWTDYCALAGGFTANGGVFRTTITPNRGGGPASVVLRPRDHGLDERIGVRTGGKNNEVRIGATETAVTVKGSIPAKSDVFVEEFRHPDPVALFGHSLVGALRRAGIEVSGFDRQRNVAGQGRAVFTLRSPLAGAVPAVLLDSNNAVADQLFYAMGHRLGAAGTRKASAAAVRALLAQHGVDTGDMVLVDGSGLSKATRVEARSMVGTLRALRKASDEGWKVFVSDLPLSGATGTLKNRMKGTAAEGRVRGKTGWISGASGLSGVVLDAAGKPRLAYSILVNYPRVGGLNNAAWKPMQDAICASLVEAIDATVGAGR